ncbi:MAG: CapA family protein [Bacillota bacterium]|nr:CapA family protein [Bacillota bacterium]
MKKKLAFIIPVIILIASISAIKLINNPGLKDTAASYTESVRTVTTQSPDTPKQTAANFQTVPLPETSLKSDNTVRIMATGDILLGRGVKYWIKAQGKDYRYPFEKVADYLKQGDIIFGNLEESITSSEHSLTGIEQKGGKYVFKNDVESIDGIEFAGFNLLNIANNHILDYYEQGLFDTLDILDKNGIAHAGAGRNIDEARKPAIIEKNGIKVGLLSYTEMAEATYNGNPPLCYLAGPGKAGVAPKKLEYIKEDISKLRPLVDIVLVSLHWGVEYDPNLSPGQQEFAHEVINAGADMIIGHHPHQIKGIEIYNGKPILYSLGNFISDQNESDNQEGFFIDAQFSTDKIISLKAIPFKIVQKSQVVPVYGSDARQLLDKLTGLSVRLGSKCSISDDKVIFDFQ